MEFKLTEVEHTLCVQAMSGESGATLIDVLLDKVLLKTANTPDEAMKKAGQGEIIKCLRDLHNESPNFIKPPKPKQTNE